MEDINQFRETPITDANKQEYSHSSNSLFHFVNRIDYLITILDNKIIYPRYFKEDISYLNLCDPKGNIFDTIAVLGICFCDIPLSAIWIKERVNVIEKEECIEHEYCHSDLYGSYAIAFSKDWSVKKEISPVIYFSEECAYTKLLNVIFKDLMETEANEDFSELFISLLMRCKPLKGYMSILKDVIEGDRIYKNFYNEQEWRFVPQTKKCDIWSESYNRVLSPIIANPNVFSYVDGNKELLNQLSDDIQNNGDGIVGLKYEYEDIKYLTVKDEPDRDLLINHIYEMCEKSVNDNEKHELLKLISKIIVLEDIKRDF